MTPAAKIAMIAYVPLVFALFNLLPPRRAMLTSMVGAWLFLPALDLDLPGLPPFDKTTVSVFAVFAASFVFDPGRLASFRPKWFDLPIVVWVLCPIPTSLANDLGFYNGLSDSFRAACFWLAPYLLGRVYFRDAESLREAAVAIFIGALLYVPLCLFEVRMSPQLHNMVYGVISGSFIHSRRFGGWRPIVFMYGGLSLGLWMSAASVIGYSLWVSRRPKALWSLPLGVWCGVLWVTTVLVKSTGAILLGLLSVGLFTLIRWSGARGVLLVLGLSVPLFLFTRIVMNYQFDAAVGLAGVVFGEDRAQSLQFRIDNEYLLQDRAWERPVWGWGGFGRSRVYDEYGKDIVTTDSLWVIAFGTYGLVGVTALFASLVMPLFLLAARVPPRLWRQAEMAPVLMLGLVVWMSVADKMLNALATPLHVLVGAALLTFASQLRPARRVARAGGSGAAAGSAAGGVGVPGVAAASPGARGGQPQLGRG